MKKLLLSLALLTTGMFTIQASADTTTDGTGGGSTSSDLSGVYTLTANGFTQNTGAIPTDETIRIYKTTNEDGSVRYCLYGLMNRSNNVFGTLNATGDTLTVAGSQYVYGQGITMIFLAEAEANGTLNMFNPAPWKIKVNGDGTMSFDKTLGFWNFGWTGATQIEGIKGGTFTKQASPATLTSEDLAGTYTFKATSVDASEVTERLNSNIKTDGFTLSVTPAEAANTFNVKGLLGSDSTLVFTYYPESGIFTSDAINGSHSRDIVLAGDDDEAPTWKATCMFSNLNFIVDKAADGTVTLNTNTGITINASNLDGDDADGVAYTINGGTATKASATGVKAIESVDNNNKVEVYSTDGRLVGTGDVKKLNLGHGIYVVKSGKKAVKVAL